MLTLMRGDAQGSRSLRLLKIALHQNKCTLKCISWGTEQQPETEPWISPIYPWKPWGYTGIRATKWMGNMSWVASEHSFWSPWRDNKIWFATDSWIPQARCYIKAFSSDFQIVSPAFPTGSQQYFKVCALPPFKAVHMREIEYIR